MKLRPFNNDDFMAFAGAEADISRPPMICDEDSGCVVVFDRTGICTVVINADPDEYLTVWTAHAPYKVWVDFWTNTAPLSDNSNGEGVIAWLETYGFEGN